MCIVSFQEAHASPFRHSQVRGENAERRKLREEEGEEVNDLGMVGDLLGSSETSPPPCPQPTCLWVWEICPILTSDQDGWRVI